MEDEEKPQNDNVQATTDANRQRKRKKQKEVAIFGNYRNYYGYRIDQGLEEDPRIKVMRKEWFEGKSYLDIGCNSGLITITIAKKFGCQKILGIDIDSARIADAHWNLRRIVTMSESKKHPNVDKSNGAEMNNIITDQAVKMCLVEISGNHSASHLFDLVAFCKDNFVVGSSTPGDKV